VSPYDVIRDAIRNKRQVVAAYKGCVREMCPHAIGYNRHGEYQALFYQFAGESNSYLPPDGEWRCIPLSGLSDVTAREGAWFTGAGHTRPQTCVTIVHEEVAY
jgi:hypothetical protein